jgi:hypothetical protein
MILAVVLSLATAVQGAGTSFLEIVPVVPGPHVPGSTVGFEIVFHNQEGQDIDLRLAQVDFAATDPAIGIDYFAIDLGGLASDSLHVQFPAVFAAGEAPGNTIASTVYISTGPVPGFMLSVADGGALSLGVVNITLPETAGEYNLDIWNSAALNDNFGARFDYGYGPERVTLHALHGNLGVGHTTHTHSGVIIPDPATLVLLGIGGAVVGRQRRPRSC